MYMKTAILINDVIESIDRLIQNIRKLYFKGKKQI